MPDWLRGDASFEAWCDVVARCEDHARVELWIGPDVNEQLLAVRTLAWLVAHPSIVARLWLVQADQPLGESSASSLATTRPAQAKVDDRMLTTATQAWNAYRDPTPERWFALVGTELDPLPLLAETVRRLLAELPEASTGLGSSQRRVLERIDAQPSTFAELAGRNARHDPHRVYGYWDFGTLVAGLAGGEEPVIVGLPPGPFDLALHGDRERHHRYLNSRLSLSALGRALLRQEADLAAHRRIDRWWGGTHLTNDRLWRRDAGRERLIAPD